MADPFDPFAAGAEPVDEPAAAQAPAAAAFDPFVAGAEPIDQPAQTGPAFDPFTAGAEPVEPAKHDWLHEFTNALNVGASDISAGIFAAVSGLARSVAVDEGTPGGGFHFPIPGVGKLGDTVGGALEKLVGDPFGVRQANKQQVAQFYSDAADYWKDKAAQMKSAEYVDPALEDTVGAKAAHLIASTGLMLGESLIPEIGVPLLLTHNSLQRYGEVYNETGDVAKAENARNISLAGNALFLGQGHLVGEGLAKAIPEGASAISKWVATASAATGGNIATGQLIKAADAAALAPEGKRMAAFTDALKDITIPDAAVQLAFGIHTAVAQASAARPEIPIAAEAASRARTVAPRTAEALQKVVDETVAETPPPASAAPLTIAGPALTTPEGAVLAEGKVGDTHASLTSEALPKYLDASPEADPSSMVHQFRASDGTVLPRTAAWTAAKAAGQIKPEALAMKEASAAKDGKPPELHSQDLQGAPFTESPRPATAAREVPPVIPTQPLPEPAPPPTPREVAIAAPRTPEERAAKVTEGTAALREEVAKTGIVPSHADIRGQLGDAKAATTLRAELTAEIGAKYPPEALPEGATESTTKNALTGDELPSINEGGKLRPKFTNDPNLTAQQIDNGVAGTDKANRLYVPDEIMDADQLNPAIDTAYDKEAGKFYITKVNSEFGEVSKPGDFEEPYRAAKALQKAHQLVLGGTPDEVQQIANRVAPEDNPVGQALVENGFAADAIPYQPDEVDVPEGAVAGIKYLPSAKTDTAKTNIEALKRTKLLTPAGSDIAPMLQAIASRELPAFPWMRIMVNTLSKSGVDLSKVDLLLVDRPNAKYAGLYSPDPTDVTRGQITLNVGVPHEGGVISTALHELFHHATLVKVEPDYKRTPVEQRAYDNLQTLFDHATQEIYKINFGREGTPEEIAQFRQDQVASGDTENRTYYGLSSLREFISEALSNPKFMKALQQIEGVPGIRVGSKIRNLLAAVRDALKTLFTGSTSRNATLDQVLDQSLQFIEAGAVEHARAAEVPFVAEAATKKGAAPVIVDGPGWVTPDGKFVPADESAGVRVQGELAGGHEQAALEYLKKNNPAAAQELEQQLTPDESGGVDYGKVTEFMEKNGFVRVTGGGRGGTIYITGQPSRAQRQLLIDNAIEQKATLVHDTGDRSRTLFSPDQAFSAPAEEPSPTAPKITATETGHDVEIPPDATKTELQESLASLDDPTNGIKPEDKARIKDELTNALGPTITLQGPPAPAAPAAPGGPAAPAAPGGPAAPAAPGGPAAPAAPGGPAAPLPTLSKRKAGERIIYGYDAVNNIANGRGKQIANSVALDFGSSKKPTPEQELDRAAAPFVVEAGGNKDELIRDLMQVIHSKDPELAAKYAPIIQHAIDNFARLDATTQNYRVVTKEQLDREHAAGVTTGELDNYVTRLLEQPDNQVVLPGSGGQGRSAYFTKGRKFEKLADAIKEGYAPKTTDIVDLTQRRVEAGERLVQQKLLEQELRTLATPDGSPILSNMDEYESIVGKKELAVPRGYTLVQTGGRPLVVNAQLAPVFKALYGDSTISEFLKKPAGWLKKNTLMFDTFHVGRIMFKELAYSKGGGRVGYNKGLSLLEYTPQDVQRAVAAGDISQSMADYTNEVLPSGLTRRGATEEMLKRGLNVGKVSDNLLAEHSASLPIIENFNPWVFQKLSRGAMIQTALENFERNMTRFPERGIEGNARQTAKESNEVFGNMQNQGLFTNKNYQDLARSLVLAPNWAESQLRAELRGYGQIARSVGEAATGKFRLGTVAQGQLTVILGMLAANQIANYIATGHSTFQNKEEHVLDAFIPGGNRGFWFSPLEIGAEYAHMAGRYFSQHQNPIDVVKQIASNKLGPVGRSATTLISGRDFAGRSFATNKDRVVAALTDLVPLPIGLSGTFERDPRQEAFGPGIPGLPGFRRNRQSGAAERQALQSVGLKVTPAMSPTSEMFALAHPFRSDRSYQGPVEYRDLRAALDNQDEPSVQKELALLASRGKTLNQLQSAIGVGTRQKFTDSTVREVAFVRSLTPEQKKIYEEAQHEHAAHAKALMAALKSAPPEVRSKLRANLKPELPSP